MIELPPLHVVATIGPDFISGNPQVEIAVVAEASALARERILMARIAELQADAARYRALLYELSDDCRHAFGVHRDGNHIWALHCASRRLQIDAAMAKGEKQ